MVQRQNLGACMASMDYFMFLKTFCHIVKIFLYFIVGGSPLSSKID